MQIEYSRPFHALGSHPIMAQTQASAAAFYSTLFSHAKSLLSWAHANKRGPLAQPLGVRKLPIWPVYSATLTKTRRSTRVAAENMARLNRRQVYKHASRHIDEAFMKCREWNAAMDAVMAVIRQH